MAAGFLSCTTASMSSAISTDPKIRQIDCYDPKQGNFRFYHSAVTIPKKPSIRMLLRRSQVTVTLFFSWGKENSTLKEISETLGKETIDLYNTSDTRGSNRPWTELSKDWKRTDE